MKIPIWITPHGNKYITCYWTITKEKSVNIIESKEDSAHCHREMTTKVGEQKAVDPGSEKKT